MRPVLEWNCCRCLDNALLVFPGRTNALSLKVLGRLKAGDSALVPAFWSVEVLNSLLIAEKRGRISAEQTRGFLDDLDALSPILDSVSVEQVFGPVQSLCGRS